MPRRKDGEKTKQMILEAAATMFAKKGFQNTTNADIVKLCGGINPALISYYFVDKATLYKQAWLYAYDIATKNFPMDKVFDRQNPPEVRLFAFIETCLKRSATKESTINSIIHQEISSTTGILTEIHMQLIGSMQELIGETAGEILSDDVPEFEKKYAMYSILAMILVPIRKIRELDPNFDGHGELYDLEERIRHVQEFALGGLLQLNQKYGKTD